MQRRPNDPNPEAEPPDDSSRHDPYAALRFADFRLYLVGNVISVLGLQMQTVAVLWQVHRLAKEPIALACIGLVQVVPVVALAFKAGHVADRFDRRRVVMTCLVVISLASAGLALTTSQSSGPQVFWQLLGIYACLLVSGIARAFMQPAKAALLPLIVPRGHFSNAVTWSMSGFQLASVLGPALGGGLIAVFLNPAAVFMLDAVAALTFVAMLSQIRSPVKPVPQFEDATPASAGLTFVWNNKILLGAMTLDLFAVLFGGATALLPIFAEDILAVGPTGQGWMQSAPAAGALIMSFLLAHSPPLKHAGRALLASVAGFGLATIVFGLSQSFALSLAMLFLTGVFDTISVVVRHTLVQVLTPDEKRGRVSAINGLFIGASNELGGFESGLVAQFFGPRASVVAGGIGTLLVVSIAGVIWPQLRGFGRLDSARPVAGPSELLADKNFTA